MTFPFTSGIPAAANNPSVDQGPMQENYQSTEQILNVDHVTFNNADGGKHQKISFNANNAPGGVPLDPYSFIFTANNSAGHPYPFFLNSQQAAVADALAFLPDLTISGTNYGFKFGTLIFNFGVRGTPGAVTFAIPFPTNAFTITATANNSGGDVPASVSGFGLTGATLNSSAINAVYYIAIGN